MQKPSHVQRAILLGLAACAADEPVEPGTPPLPQVEILGNTDDMGRGAEVQMEATVPGHSEARILWSVSDQERASISASGLLRTSRCAPLGEFDVIATWAEHPEQQAARKVHVSALGIETFFVQSMADTATGAALEFENIYSVVDVEISMPHECTPAERIALIALAGDQTMHLASVPVDPIVPRQQRTVLLRWDTTKIPNGNYAIVPETVAPSGGLRSNAPLGVRVANPKP